MIGAILVSLIVGLILVVVVLAAYPLILWLATREPHNRKD